MFDPLCTMARWNNPFAEGIASSVLTFPPPPDWPKIVTLFGSPPKFAMLSRTHSSAATASSIPALLACANFSPPRSARYRNPKELRRWFTVTGDHVMLASHVRAVVDRVATASASESAAVEPDHNRPLAAAARAVGPDVQMQTILADRLFRDGGRNFGNLRMRTLRRFRAPFHRIQHAGPRLRLEWGHEAVRAFCRCAVGDASKGAHLINHRAANLARRRLHHRACGRSLNVRSPQNGRRSQRRASQKRSSGPFSQSLDVPLMANQPLFILSLLK